MNRDMPLPLLWDLVPADLGFREAHTAVSALDEALSRIVARTQIQDRLIVSAYEYDRDAA